MLKKENRISKRTDILEVKEKGIMITSSLLSLLLLKKKGKDKKFGVIISKKISKKAVERNKIKRLVMESLRQNWEAIENGSYGLFLVRKNILGKKMEKVEKEVKKVLSI